MPEKTDVRDILSYVFIFKNHKIKHHNHMKNSEDKTNKLSTGSYHNEKASIYRRFLILYQIDSLYNQILCI